MTTKAEILAASTPPRGKSTLVGKSVDIRGLNTAEQLAFAGAETRDSMVPICAACILDNTGKPMFTVDELKAMAAGVLSPVLGDILALSLADEEGETKN